MTDHEHGDDVKEDLLASLLTRAPLRPTPRPDAAARAYATLHAQWRSDVVRRKRRWRVAWLALAATVVAAIGLVAMLPAPSTEPVAVARLAHLSGGTATIGNARSRVRSPVTAGTPVMSGDIVRTGTDARIALAWHDGGSLRLRENTALEITTPVTVRLLRGTVYFDSGAVAAAGAPSPHLPPRTARCPPAESCRPAGLAVRSDGTQGVAAAAGLTRSGGWLGGGSPGRRGER